MAVKASEYVKVLQGWVGKNEKDGSHKVIIDLYNKCRPLPRNYMVTYRDSWCAATLGAAAVACGDTSIFPIECSCGKVIEKAKEMGIWIETENRAPSIGEWCLYDWDDRADNFKVTDNKGWPEHVGAVESIDTATGKFVVIEGNKKDAVGRRELEINGRYIRGFVAPKYAPETDTPEPTSPFVLGQKVKLNKGAKYTSGKAPKSWVYDKQLYVRKISGEKIVVSTLASGAVTGEVYTKDLTPFEQTIIPEPIQNLYYPKYTGKLSSLDAMLKEIGVPAEYYGSWRKRKPLAEKNGIRSYTGTEPQNIQFKKLVLNGKLLKI